MKSLFLLVACLSWGVAMAHEQESVDFQPHVGAQVPGDAAFREAKLADYFSVPVVLELGYLGCTNLCGTTLVGADEALRATRLVPERDYRALFVSIDPRDESAAAHRRAGWHFLTGAAAAARVARAVGFAYRFEKESGQYAHPAGFVVLTPEGKVSRYFEGVRFDPGELKEAIAKAGKGETQSAFERLVLVCFHDPENGRYTATVLGSVRIAMGVLLAAAAFVAWRKLR